MRRNGIAVLLIWSICLFGPAYAVAQAGSCACAAPSWTSEVIGDLSWAHKILHDPVDRNFSGVVFLDKERLLVYEVIVTEGLSSRQSPEISSPYRLRVSIFDVVSARKTASLEWRTRLRCSSVHATSAGMLVQTGEILRLYSKDLVMLQEATLPNPDEDEPVVITCSVTGKTIFANRTNQRFSRFDVLDGGTLKPVKAWTESPPLRRLRSYSVSDTGVAAAEAFYHTRILYTDFGTGKWKVVADHSKRPWVGLPTLVTDTTLVNSSERLSYMTTSGELIFQEAFGKKHWLTEETTVAQNGRAIAVSLYRGGSDFWDTDKGPQTIAMQVLVYDLTLKKRTFTFEVAPLPKNDLDIALSPDGSTLAVLSDRRLTVCSMPVQRVAQTP